MPPTVAARSLTLLLPLLLASSSAAATLERPVRATPQLPELPALLEVMSRVAGLYADAALDFTCQELIVETGGRSAPTGGSVRLRGRRWGDDRRETYRFDYFYVFNDDPAQGELGFQDYRTYRADDSESAEPVRLEPSELGLGAYLSRAYSWIFLFQPALRGSIAFRLYPDEEVDGRPARVLHFAPVADVDPAVPRWSGRMWIDRERYQLLRVEAVESAVPLAFLVAAESAEEGEAVASRPVLFTHAAVDFGFEKNGLRFPTEVTVDGVVVELDAPFDSDHRQSVERLLDRGVSSLDRAFRIQQRYRDYRFFGVRTLDEVEARTRGERRP